MTAQEAALDKSVKTVTVNLDLPPRVPKFAHPIIDVDVRYPPAFIRALFTDPEPPPFSPCVVTIPAIDLVFWLLR